MMKGKNRLVTLVALILLVATALSVGVTPPSHASGFGLFRRPVPYGGNIPISYNGNPVDCGWFRTPYALRGSNGWYETGIYLSCANRAYGQPVLATASGSVAYIEWNNSTFGNMIVLRHQSPEGPRYCYSVYGHLSNIYIRNGQCVGQGQTIGAIGWSGKTNKVRLYFAIRGQRSMNTYGWRGYHWTPSHPNNYNYVDPWAYCSRW
jgi:murein DD-endopeptidase MepM/ murein hydrolase activator NlpD